MPNLPAERGIYSASTKGVSRSLEFLERWENLAFKRAKARAPQRRLFFTIIIIAGLFLPAFPIHAEPPASESNHTTVAIEALERLKGIDLEANPAVKAAVLNVLESARGTPDFVRIVQDFKLPDQNSGLLEVALLHPAEEAGVEAMRMILAGHDLARLDSTLRGTNSARAVEALGNTRDREIVPLLLPLINDPARDIVARRQAVKALAGTQEGATALLQLAQDDKLSADLKFIATTELNAVRWPELKARAAQLLPPPRGQNTQPLPPMAELLKMKGDAAKGAQVFTRPEVNCIGCHRVNDKGVDFGPALSEIGTKLGKDAIYEAILDPSAGIAFGYEAWQIELKSGDEAYGLIVSETPDELTIKDVKAIPTRVKKSEIVKRQQLKTSVMPAGLQQTMSTQDLVDLVEYLSSLKKAAN
jgi:putative heme-binding domain-containing protein